MPPSTIENYLSELMAVLLFKIWRGKKPSLHQFNSLRQFISNCIVPTQLTYPVVIQGLAYVHRLKQKFPKLPDLEGSECRVFLVGLIVANKHMDDCNYTNNVWSQVSGITTPEINMMEMEYLNVMEFETFLGPDYLAVFTEEMKSLAEKIGLDHALVECAQEIANRLSTPYVPELLDRRSGASTGVNSRVRSLLGSNVALSSISALALNIANATISGGTSSSAISNNTTNHNTNTNSSATTSAKDLPAANVSARELQRATFSGSNKALGRVPSLPTITTPTFSTNAPLTTTTHVIVSLEASTLDPSIPATTATTSTLDPLQ